MELKPETFKKLLPMPVTVIATINANDVPDTAPWGCHDTYILDLIMIASALPRHTLHNIRATGEFVVNIIGRPVFMEAMPISLLA